jgi:hypothetical protein
VGQSYDVAVDVRLPQGVRGEFFITAWTNPGLAVFETQLDANVNPDAPNDLQGSNFKATPIEILQQPSADLVVTKVTAPDTMTAGQSVTLSWTVENQGALPTNVDRWVDSVYVANGPRLESPGANPVRISAAPNLGPAAQTELHANGDLHAADLGDRLEHHCQYQRKSGHSPLRGGGQRPQ